MKKILLSSIILIIGITFIGRLSYLQIFSFSTDNLLEDPAIKPIYDYPERGYIYDRNGKLLVGNDPAYDVMVIPREVKPLDTLEFCKLIGLDKEDIIRIAKNIGTYDLSILPSLDCTAVPKKPATKSKLEDVLFEEAKIDVDRIAKQAVYEAELISL